MYLKKHWKRIEVENKWCNTLHQIKDGISILIIYSKENGRKESKGTQKRNQVNQYLS